MNKLYVCFDGDDVGQKVGTAVLMDDANALRDISAKIEAATSAVKMWAQSHGGEMISSGGDEGAMIVPPGLEHHLEELQQIYSEATGATVTIGYGLSLSQAGKALMAGKLSGKNQVLGYDENTEQILAEAHQHAGSGEGSDEENKIDEHYLSHLDGEDGGQGEGEEIPQDDLEGAPQGEETDPGVEPCDCENCQGSDEEAPQGDEEIQDEASPEEGEIGEQEIPGTDEEVPVPSQDGEILPEDQQESGEEALDGESEELDPQDAVAAATGEESQDGESQESEDGIEIPESENMAEDSDPEAMVTAAAGDEESQEDPGIDEAAQQDEEIPQDDAPQGDEEMPQDEMMAPEAMDADQQGELPEESAPQGDEEMQPQGDEEMQPQGDEEALLQDQMASPDIAGDGEEAGQDEQGVSDLDLLSELLADAGSADDVKQRVAMVLEKFKANRELILTMKEKAPEMYESIMLMLKNMIDMARHLAPESPPEDAPEAMDQTPPEAAEQPEEEEEFPKQMGR